MFDSHAANFTEGDPSNTCIDKVKADGDKEFWNKLVFFINLIQKYNTRGYCIVVLTVTVKYDIAWACNKFKDISAITLLLYSIT
jgi:hypothetical protein